MFTRTVTTAVCLLALAAWAHANPYNGSVWDVNVEKRHVEVKTVNGFKTFALTRDAKITVNSQPAGIDALRIGQGIRLACEGRTLIAVQVVAFDRFKTDTPAGKDEYLGRIELLSADRKQVTIRTDRSITETIRLPDTVEVRIDGKVTGPDRLAIGQEVFIACQPGTLTASKVVMPIPPPPPSAPQPPKPPPDVLLDPATFRVGQTGKLRFQFEVLQIVDGSNMRVKSAGIDFWISGVSTAGMVDGRDYELRTRLKVSGTKQYKTVTGGSRTVFLLEPAEK